MIGRNPGSTSSNAGEAARQQPGLHGQDRGERHLADDEARSAADAPPATRRWRRGRRRCSTALTSGRADAHIGARPTSAAGDHGEDGRGGDDRAVGRDLADARQARPGPARPGRRRPSAPPAATRRRRLRPGCSPSASTWRTSCSGLAPSAARTASSRCRTTLRASIRLATLTAAISSSTRDAAQQDQQRRPHLRRRSARGGRRRGRSSRGWCRGSRSASVAA